MSYSIREGIEDDTRHLTSLKAVAERFPRAELRNGRWYAEFKSAEVNALVYDNGNLHAVVEVAGIHVFRECWDPVDMIEVLYALKRKPELYDAVLAIAARKRT